MPSGKQNKPKNYISQHPQLFSHVPEDKSGVSNIGVFFLKVNKVSLEPRILSLVEYPPCDGSVCNLLGIFL